jgi:hypothetical protein
MWRHDLPEASLESVEVTLSSHPPQAEQESCAWASRAASRLNSQSVGFDVTRMRSCQTRSDSLIDVGA